MTVPLGSVAVETFPDWWWHRRIGGNEDGDGGLDRNLSFSFVILNVKMFTFSPGCREGTVLGGDRENPVLLF